MATSLHRMNWLLPWPNATRCVTYKYLCVDVMSFWKCWCWTNTHRRTHARMHTRTRAHALYKCIDMISDVAYLCQSERVNRAVQHTAACSRRLLLLLLEQWPLMEHGTFTYDMTWDSRDVGHLHSVCLFYYISPRNILAGESQQEVTSSSHVIFINQSPIEKVNRMWISTNYRPGN